MAKSPCFGPLTRNCLAFRGSTGRVSPDPETWGPEMSGSPGQISLDLGSRLSGPPSPGQVQSGPATTIGAQWEESRAEDCMVSTALAGMQPSPEGGPGMGLPAQPPHPSGLPPGPLWDLDSCPAGGDGAKLHSQEDPPAELLPQLEQAEPTEAQPTGPAAAQAEVPYVEPEPAPPAASCPALGPQPESVAAPSPAAVLGHLVAARQSVSPPELHLAPAPGPLPLFPSLTLAHVLGFTLALIYWIYINNRSSF
ncbi:proline-rich protein 2-like isoform X2 [Heterocephalus glaber]|uniref:Proline-rich protein 2-like isoform X2 n=1 Tax=Heterocephalus glaber TaxID=10181 RepID=A0AAX6RA24_HETGA|nr:proline-rich protein 2-like isoform X2 [Heterocephalus glaber]